jgi:hypothetical protein
VKIGKFIVAAIHEFIFCMVNSTLSNKIQQIPVTNAVDQQSKSMNKLACLQAYPRALFFHQIPFSSKRFSYDFDLSPIKYVSGCLVILDCMN